MMDGELPTQTTETTADPLPSGKDDLAADVRAALAELSDEPDHDTGTASDEPAPERRPASGKTDAPAGVPAAWGKTISAEMWTNLPESVRDRIIQRERDIDAKLRDNAVVLKELGPTLEAIRQRGGDPAKHLQNLLGWSQAFAREPVKALEMLAGQSVRDARTARSLIASLADRWGLEDLVYLAGGRNSRQQDDEDGDDYEERPRGRGRDRDSPRVIELEQRLAQREVAEAVREWKELQAETTKDGDLAYPMAAELVDDVRAVLKTAPNLSYKQAYRLALDGNDDIAAKVEEYRRTQAAARARGQRRETVSRARSSDLPRGRSDTAAPPARPKADDLRADVLGAFQELGVRF